MKNLTTLRASKLLVAFTGKSDLVIMETQGTTTQGFVVTDEVAGVTKYNVENEKIIDSIILSDSYAGSVEENNTTSELPEGVREILESSQSDAEVLKSLIEIVGKDEAIRIAREYGFQNINESDNMEIIEMEIAGKDENGTMILKPVSEVDTTYDTVAEAEDVPTPEASIAEAVDHKAKWLKVSKIATSTLANYFITVISSPLKPNTKKPVLATYELTRIADRKGLFLIEKVEEGVGNTPFFSHATFEEAKELISNTHGITYVDKKPRKLADISTLHLTMSAHVITFLDAMGFDKSTITIDQAVALKRQFMDSAEAILGEPKLGVLDAFNS